MGEGGAPVAIARFRKEHAMNKAIVLALGVSACVGQVGGGDDQGDDGSGGSGGSGGDDGGTTTGPAGRLRISGPNIVDDQGHTVRLTGVNWFGLETPNYTPHGLWQRS